MFSLDKTSIFCINLPDRHYRRGYMQDQFNKLDIVANFVPGAAPVMHKMPELSIKNRERNGHGIYCCALAHTRLISKLFSDYALIFEDDAILCDDFMERLHMIESIMPDFDICYIGGHFDNPDCDVLKTSIEHVYEAKNVAGTYGYIINNASPVVSFIQRNWTYDWGWDEFLANHVQTRFKCYAFLPFLVGHESGHSDVANHYVDYNCNQYFQKEPLI